MKRLVLYGPPLVGKTTLLGGIAARHHSSVKTFHTQSPSDDGLTCRGARTQFSLASSLIEIATLVGPTQTREIWSVVLGGAAAVVLVLDGQRERKEANRSWIAALHQTPPAGCVIVTKLDLPNATVDAGALGDPRFVAWPVVETHREDLSAATLAIDMLARGL